MIHSDGLVQRTVGHAAIIRPPRPLHRECFKLVARAALLAFLVAGCSESTGPSTGAVHADLTTTGALTAVTGTLAVTAVRNVDFDPNGFSLSVDGGVPTFVPGAFPGYTQTVTLSGLPAGAHSLSLSGVAGNCIASVTSALSVMISPGETAKVLVTIVCVTREVTS